MVRERILVSIIAAAFSINIFSQGAYIPPEKPKLIIGIVVEQLRFDQLERIRDNLGENGIRRLINEGTTYRNALYGHLLTQGAPGLATINTGTDPSFHGIPSDNWYEPLRNEMIYCTHDVDVNAVGGSFETGFHSPANLLASTFSDELKLSGNRGSKVFGIGFTQYSAIFGAGHAGDGAFWFDDRTGSWMSSTWYMNDLPPWMNDFNASRLSDKYLSGVWSKLKDEEFYTTCMPDSSAHESGFSGQFVFPYDLNRMSMTGGVIKKREYTMLKETPFSNSLTTELAIKLIEEEQLGADDNTDFLSICYSASDYVGHRFGPSSAEATDVLYRLDKDIEQLLAWLHDKLGKRNILIYFTAAHGVSEVPDVLTASRIPSGYFRQNQAIMLLRSYLNAIYGQGDWVRGYYERQIFLNRTLIEDAKIPLEEIQSRVSRFMIQFSGVAASYPFFAFETNNFSNGHLRKISNSYSPLRSGDVILILQPGWIDRGDYVTNHNSPYDYDAHVPLIWYGWSINRATVNRKVNMTDIAATLSSIVRIPLPNACSGEPLVELMR
ncbi:MAG: alkaline phosphatase family protein [Bacteroidales bacterium]|nr:alkaline phosphatase family protein [Bacteroidales bacterium]